MLDWWWKYEIYLNISQNKCNKYVHCFFSCQLESEHAYTTRLDACLNASIGERTYSIVLATRRYLYTRVQSCLGAYVCIHWYALAHVYSSNYEQACIPSIATCVGAYAYMRTYMPTILHTCTYTRIYTRTFTCTYIYTHALNSNVCRQWGPRHVTTW